MNIGMSRNRPAIKCEPTQTRYELSEFKCESTGYEMTVCAKRLVDVSDC